MNTSSSKLKRLIIGLCCFAALFILLEATGSFGTTVEYDRTAAIAANNAPIAESDVTQAPGQHDQGNGFADGTLAATSTTATSSLSQSSRPPVVHIKTPEVVRAVYMTSCIASGPGLRAPLLGIVDRTRLNALVIDVKDYTGYLSMDLDNPTYPTGGKSCMVSDMRQFLAQLGEKGIYRIARIAVMQDPYYAAKHPGEAVVRKDNGAVWKDKKGLAFVDPGSEEFWKYIRDIAYASYEAGFDEVNFDYVRYPTDGAISNMSFKLTGSSTKPAMMKRFFAFIGKSMRDKNIPSSVDLFGMVTTATGDLGIGQVLEDVLPHFDYIAPMVYPSHYPTGFNKWKDPNTVPGPLTEYVMGEAVRRAQAIGLPATKLRTWVQDFDYGKDYTSADVRAIISASEKVGVKSYMSWDPSNRYTETAYGLKGTEPVANLPKVAATSTPAL